MSANTKIVVLRMKQLIYTGVLAAAGLLVLLLLLLLSHPDKKEQPDATPTVPNNHAEGSAAPNTDQSTDNIAGTVHTTQSITAQTTEVLSTALYVPGVYTTQLVLGDHNIEIEVIVDDSSITSLQIIDLPKEAVSMYPLLPSTFDTIREQIYAQQSLDSITYESYNKYTSMVLIEAIRNSLDKASISETLPE